MKFALGVTLAASTVLVGIPPASAHIAIDDDTAYPGQIEVLRIQASNEGTTSVVRVEFDLPDAVPFAFVTPRADDWTVTMEHRTLAEPIQTEDGPLTEVVDKVVYAGNRILPGQLELFYIEVGPLPDTPGERLQFTAVETFEDGTVVRWDQPSVAGRLEPDRPGPYLDIVPRPGPAGSDGWSGLDVVAFVVGGLGLLTGVTALWKLRRQH